MLNSLLSMWRKSSHEHWTIPEQRSPHLLYMYKTRGILAVWLYSDIRNILTIDANFAQKQFSTRTATCGRDNKNVTVSLNTWKLKHLLSRTAMSLVASQLRISGLWRKFTIWRKLLFLGVLFRKFSYQRWKYSRQTGPRDTLVFASRKRRPRANYLFISTASYLDLNRNEEKTCYLQWILVKLTVLQVGLFVMWGTHDLSPEHERWHCKV